MSVRWEEVRGMSDKERRAYVQWKLPFVCEATPCRRRFRTARGCAQHHRQCWHNRENRMYASGEFLPLLNGKGQVVGFCMNTPAALESMANANAVLGIPRPRGLGARIMEARAAQKAPA